MKYNRKLNFFIILIVMGMIVSFAHNYNSYVKSSYAEASDNNRNIIKYYNSEIITTLLEQDSTDDWTAVLQEYEELSIEIENSSSIIVAGSVGVNFKKPAMKVRTPFVYHDQIYIIESSMYVFKNYVEGVGVALANFVLIEFVFV